MTMLTRARRLVRAAAGNSVAARRAYSDLPAAFEEIRQRAAPYTMTSVERMYGLYEAVRYIVRVGVPGDLVECGVWRGGSTMVSALTLRQMGDIRDLWLYDTFEGMPAPTARDRAWSGERAADELAGSARIPNSRTTWSWATQDDVEANMRQTGYPAEHVHYIAGKVEETIPAQVPDHIALLRLDTDWYESTRHELEHLWPRLAPAGVLIVDDYGHWQGAREAVDEYFAGRPDAPLLNRLDYTGRIAVKTGPSGGSAATRS